MTASLKLNGPNVKDPDNILGRLYDAASMALYDINAEGITFKERLTYMTSIARICVTLNALNRGQADVPAEYGAKVRAYEGLFTSKNAAGRRVVRGRGKPHLIEPIQPIDLDDSDDGGLGVE